MTDEVLLVKNSDNIAQHLSGYSGFYTPVSAPALAAVPLQVPELSTIALFFRFWGRCCDTEKI